MAGQTIGDDFLPLRALCIEDICDISLTYHVHGVRQIQEVILNVIDHLVVIGNQVPIDVIGIEDNLRDCVESNHLFTSI